MRHGVYCFYILIKTDKNKTIQDNTLYTEVMALSNFSLTRGFDFAY